MNCKPCLFCDQEGVYYSYGEETSYIIEKHPEMFPSLENILTPIFKFKLFSGFKASSN